MKRSRLRFAAAALGLGCGQACALSLDYQLKGQAVALAEDHPDLGQKGGGSRQELYLNLSPWAHAQLSREWAAFLRVQAFVPTARVEPGSGQNNSNAGSNSYVALQDAWIDYGGLTSYPGETLRIGRQRIRQDDAQWWDQDADAVHWIFDTTEIDADLGVAHQFSNYRSDGLEVTPAQRDRTYLFGSLGGQWQPGHHAGFRWVHANDAGGLPQDGAHADGNSKLQDAQLTWVGLYADRGFYDERDYPSRAAAPPFSYWAGFTYLVGHQRLATTDGAHLINGRLDQDVGAYAGELGLRYRLPLSWPLQVGAAYVYSSGGDSSAGGSRQYQQTGMQSNYSRFTGTEALINRYNDALRAELGNLQVLSGFLSLDLDPWDASLVAQRFLRSDGGAPVVTDGISAVPLNGSTSLGWGYDLVLSRYFNLRQASPRANSYTPGEDNNASIRLRASLFQPGEAYGADRSDRYRILLEGTIWY